MTDYSQFKCILENNKQELLKTISSSEFIQKSDLK
ncbi:MAG: hypothetical protein K0R71_992 [Bacillales bacterium]|nr:hypothetical protein [Bacillales bacterium]